MLVLKHLLPSFLKCLANKWQGTVPQKSACLKLYGQYMPEEAEARGWKKECDLPPGDLEVFRRAWGQHKKICLECAKLVPAEREGSFAAMSVP